MAAKIPKDTKVPIRVLLLLLGAFILLGLSENQIRTIRYQKPTVERPTDYAVRCYPFLESGSAGIPLLRSFSLDFREDDHHIERLGIDYGWDDENKAHVYNICYQDDNGDDEFSTSLEYNYYSGILDVLTVEGANETKVPLNVPENWDFALIGFLMTYDKGDAHVRELYVQYDEADKTIRVRMLDTNYLRTYTWKVTYTLIPTSFTTANQVVWKGTSAGSATQPTNTSDKYLQSFLVWFPGTGEDHHIDRFAISLTSDRREVVFTDNSGSTLFNYEIKYGELKYSETTPPSSCTVRR